MTEFERRLTDALSAREQQIDVDPDAWQTHLDLARAHAGGRPGAFRRWRAPALVAASVVGLGLIGGIVAQTALSGGSPVSPAGPHSSAVSTPSDPGVTPGPGRNATTTERDVPTSADRRTARPSPPASTGAAGPLQSARAPGRTERSTRSMVPPSAWTSAPPPRAEMTSQKPPATTVMDPAPHSARTTNAGETAMPTSHRPDAGDAAGVDTAASGPQTSLMIDLSSLMPCGAQLPDLGKITSGITVESGPHGDIVTTTEQTAPLLAVGYAVLDGHGRIASTTGGDAAVRKAAGSTLSGGRSARADEPSILPTGLCAGDSGSNAGAAIDQCMGDPSGSTVFQVGLQGALPAGTYSAVDVVLVGDDLAHAAAYRTGQVWQFATG